MVFNFERLIICFDYESKLGRREREGNGKAVDLRNRMLKCRIPGLN
jgi:hypothetical protein